MKKCFSSFTEFCMIGKATNQNNFMYSTLNTIFLLLKTIKLLIVSTFFLKNRSGTCVALKKHKMDQIHLYVKHQV